jgi:SAM-dependent methyltransferase
MNHQTVEETIKAGYREATSQYRRDDEIEVTTLNHRRISATLREICGSFSHAINALDVGCGTGRYFHCLTNVDELTGMDITGEMLSAANNPVRREQISVRNIRLLRANIYSAEFPPGSFHLIYSLGMFGNGCPVTPELCNRFYDWLVPGGVLFFNTVDVAGLPLWYRARRRARRIIYPWLIRRWQALLDTREARHPFCGLDRSGLEEILRASRFREFEVRSRVCESPLWSGRHLECIATRPD